MYTVKQLADLTDVTPDTVRYYTRIGIIKPRRDAKNRYRYYAEHDVYRIGFVKKAKSFGLTMQDIIDIFEYSRQGKSPCSYVKTTVSKRHQEIQKKLHELRLLEEKIRKALAAWSSRDDHIPNEDLICPLIEGELC